MGWLIDNMNALENYQNNANTRDRQVREDAYQDEQRDRTRKAQLKEDDVKIEETRMITDQLKRLETEGDGVDPAKSLGVLQGPTNAVPDTTPKQPTYSDGVKQDYLNSARLAALRGNHTGFQSAVSGFRKVRMGEDSAKISNYVMNAPPEELSQLMGKITSDPKNSYNAVYDPASGYTTIKLGDKPVQMNRAQLGQYFSAKHRLSQGDDSALKDIEGIDKDLAARVASDLNITSSLANNSNDVNHKKVSQEMERKKFDESVRVRNEAVGRAKKADDPLHALNKARAVFKSVYKRDPTGEEDIKLAGLGKDSYEKSDAEFAADIAKAGVTSGLTQPDEAPAVRQNIIAKSRELRKPPAPKNVWNDKTGEVISNGRVIGKATTPEEAKALLAKQK